MIIQHFVANTFVMWQQTTYYLFFYLMRNCCSGKTALTRWVCTPTTTSLQTLCYVLKSSIACSNMYNIYIRCICHDRSPTRASLRAERRAKPRALHRCPRRTSSLWSLKSRSWIRAAACFSREISRSDRSPRLCALRRWRRGRSGRKPALSSHSVSSASPGKLLPVGDRRTKQKVSSFSFSCVQTSGFLPVRPALQRGTSLNGDEAHRAISTWMLVGEDLIQVSFLLFFKCGNVVIHLNPRASASLSKHFLLEVFLTLTIMFVSFFFFILLNQLVFCRLHKTQLLF